MITVTTSEHSVEVEGGELYARVRAGAGPALVFLHYWGGSHRTWAPVVALLDPDSRVITYDQRGWGRSNAVPGPFTLEQLADDAQRVAAALGAEEYVLVGHSMGGKAAQLLAARRPAGLAGVVLVAPAPPEPEGITPEYQEMLAHAYDSEESADRSVDLALTLAGLSPELRRQVVQDSTGGSAPAREAWPRQAMTEDLSARVGAIEVPVLVLAGDQDKVDPPAVLARRLLPHVPGATMTVLGSTGHLSPLEVPDQVAGHISAFLTGLDHHRAERTSGDRP